MGIWDAFSEIVQVVTPWSVAEAEAPAEEPKEQTADSKSKDDGSTESKNGKATVAAEGDEDDEDGEEEEEEEEEEEIVDPKEALEEECRKSAQCAPAKHHFDECAERVHQQQSEGEAKEDCVEEFFHLAHCATACAAPKLWSKLR